jgi:propanediol dehydratase small subunit
MKLLVFLLGAVTVLQAADVSGRWTGSSEFVNRDGQVRSGPMSMTLRQSGEEVTGTAGPSAERQQEIRKGKITGDKLTFEIQDAAGYATVELTVTERTLRGQATFHRDYGVVTMKLELGRE